jgi:hypothetical protein
MTTTRALTVGDRVRRLRGGSTTGTVVRIVGEVPHQVVVVSWDRVAPAFQLMTVSASQLQLAGEAALSGAPMDSTILAGRISSLIRDHFPLALCEACAARKLNVSVADFRTAVQGVAAQADFAITHRACYGCGIIGDHLGLTPEAADEPARAAMDEDSLRLLIRRKMAEGRLPRTRIPRLWGGTGIEGVCAACDGAISKHFVALTALDVGMTTTFHVRCFRLWEGERRTAR